MLRKLHRWVGLVLALPLLIQAVTGTLMILIPLFDNMRPQNPVSTVAQVGVEKMVAAARSSAPAGTIPLRYDPARWAGDSARISFGPVGERHPAFQVMIDPATGTVRGTHTASATQHFLHAVHTDLLLLPYGQTATAIMGVLLFAMAITGVILWWPKPHLWISGKWRKTIVPARKARGLRLWREAHTSLGFWTALLLAFMAGSGAILAFPGSAALLGAGGHGGHGGGKHGAGSHDGDTRPSETGLDHALAAMRTHFPDATLVNVLLGTMPSAQRFTVVLPQYGANAPAVLRYDATDDDVLMAQDPGTQPRGAKFMRWMHTLHETHLSAPTVIAPIWKVLVGLIGVALAFFTVSGVAMWVLRRRVPGRQPRRVAQESQPII